MYICLFIKWTQFSLMLKTENTSNWNPHLHVQLYLCNSMDVSDVYWHTVCLIFLCYILTSVNHCLVLFLSVVQYGISIMGVFILFKDRPPEGDCNDYTWNKKKKIVWVHLKCVSK